MARGADDTSSQTAIGSMNFTVAMVAGGDAWYRPLSVANKVAYSMVHHYDVAVVSTSIPHNHNPARHFSWQKILHLRNIIRDSLSSKIEDHRDHWVFIIDSDAFIMNMSTPLQPIIMAAYEAHHPNPLDMIMAADCNGLNAGVFFMRVSPWSLDFLNEVWSVNNPTIPNIDAWWEQAALRYLMEGSSDLRQHLWQAPQKFFNAYPPSHADPCFAKWAPGDFVFHFVAGTKIHELPQYTQMIKDVTHQVLKYNITVN